MKKLLSICNQMTDRMLCKTHPDAPHGFDRNASHNADRYVCECEGWQPSDDAGAVWEVIEAKLREKNI
jgi:hypothetical protein